MVISPSQAAKLLVPAFFCSLKIINYWGRISSAQASMKARLRPRMASAWWLLLSQESHAWFSSLGTPTLPAYNPDWLTSCLFPCGCVHATKRYEAYTCLRIPSLNRKHRALLSADVTFASGFLSFASMSMPPCGLLQVEMSL